MKQIITTKKKIVVSHPDISKPAAVRYAWSDNPKSVNLYHNDRLPASVFITED